MDGDWPPLSDRMPFKIQVVPVWAPEDDALSKASAFCYTYRA
jgi:hypothetical protein